MPNSTAPTNSVTNAHTNALTTRGIHHITTIASDPQKNHDFYTRVLGLRL
ncbi:MAG: VOC family protein, partial [Planctomycetota bacterium]|nr:VOC family protein [Planctomycetota bacterium]